MVEIASTARKAPEEQLEMGYTAEHAVRWPWVNDVRGRVWVPMNFGVVPEDFGVDRRGLQNGHVRIELAEFAAAARALTASKMRTLHD
ncbi:hypothetical protein JS562_54605 [Agrobacterium sp. S2]|nr:hypothetical protein [Agrobacterium sp. S2]